MRGLRASTAVWAMLAMLLLSALLPAISMPHATNLPVSDGTMLRTFEEGEGSNSTTSLRTPPTIQDFLINNTATGNATQFAFYVSDSTALQNCTFSNDNGTGTWTNSSLQLTGTGPEYANFTVNAFTTTTLLSFDFWLWNTNSSIPPAATGIRTLAIYNTTMPYTSLGNAITAVDDADNWTALLTFGSGYYDPYLAVVLGHASISGLTSMIDNYASKQDWWDVIEWSAFCNKLNITQYSDVQTDINYALGNYSMIVETSTYSYPCDSVSDYTTNSTGYPICDTNSMWVLYGYYFAAQSWALSYNTSITTKWNITTGYNFFNYSVASEFATDNCLPTSLYSGFITPASPNRYYDEDACTIEDYLLFYALLNVTNALTQAVFYWNWVNIWHWNSGFGVYSYNLETPNNEVECEAGFFLQIVTELDYYSPNLGNWTNVAQDTGSKFLLSGWSSDLWYDNVVIHAVDLELGESPIIVNSELRLSNTIGAWDAILAAYLNLNSTLESDAVSLLSGNTATNTPQAWNLLLASPLFNSSTLGFISSTAVTTTDPLSTAQGEMLLFMMGIIPQTSTIAFPLEQLVYEDKWNIDPILLALNINQTTRQITIPVVTAGTITFDFGQSPITYNFTSGGVYTINFTSSWNMISSVTYQSVLPGNLIYFYLPAHAAVSEFPRLLVLPLFMAATLVALSTYRRKRLVYRNIARAG